MDFYEEKVEEVKVWSSEFAVRSSEFAVHTHISFLTLPTNELINH